MASFRRPWMWVFGVALLATIAHLGYRMYRMRKVGMVTVSDLQTGTPLPDFQVSAAVGSAHAGLSLPSYPGCWTLVVYSPECVHCGAAAGKDAAQDSTSRYPVVWVGQGTPEANSAFASKVGSQLAIFASPDVRAKLHVRAFPAAFLIGGDRTIRLAFPYQGGVTKAVLQRFCGEQKVSFR